MDYYVNLITEFKSKVGIFKEVVDLFGNNKIKHDIAGNGVMKFIYKLFINNGYGKFGERIDRTSRILVPREEAEANQEAIFSSRIQYGDGSQV